MSKKPLTEIRREYGQQALDKSTADADPLKQFKTWFDDVLETHRMDPTSMVVATVDEQQRPDTRIILLKDIVDGCFVFYTNYLSAKGLQLSHNQHIALNFYWPVLCRQVRIRGTVSKTSNELSDTYFSSRPIESQISAAASAQSEVIPGRKVLEDDVARLSQQQADQPIQRPEYWGGYAVKPNEFEYWQGRDNRLHDRLRYLLKEGNWLIERLAP